MKATLEEKINRLRAAEKRLWKHLSEDEFGVVRRTAEGFGQEADWLEELKRYRDLEEQGRLLVLPCKVGDTVYCFDYGRITEYKITGYSFGTAEKYIDEPVSYNQTVFYYSGVGSVIGSSVTGSFAESIIGKTVFFTYEEAEAALERRRNNKNA